MNRTLTVALAFIFVFVSAFAAMQISGMKKPAPRKPIEKNVKMVKSRVIQNETITSKLEITGRLIAKHKVELFAEVGGTLLPNNNRFREGNYFKKGATLIEIDATEQKLNLLAQKSSLMNQITLMLPDLKSDYAESFPAWENYLKEMNVEQPLSPLPSPISDQERYFISARNLYNLYYSIQSQEERLKKYRIYAPFSGSIASSNITEGTLVRLGQKLGDFINTTSYEMEAAVNEEDISLLKIGSQVNLFSNNTSKTWKGRVVRISNIIDPATQTVKVFINVSGKDLKEGMYLNAIVEGKQIEKAVEISRNLLMDQNKLYIVEDSSLKIVEIKPLHYMTQTVVVQGLEDGTVLLNESVAGAYEGLKVGTY